VLGGNYAIISLLLFFFGASNDLLDYVPTSVYWQSKQVQVTPAAMEAELADPKGPDVSGLISQLADPDPLVRNKAEDSLTAAGFDIIPQLRAAAQGRDPAIADEADKTIARIGPLPKPRAIRRLMAIRALGEMERPQEAALLNALLNSPRQFEADYAAEGLARLAHHHTRPGAANADCAADVMTLPDESAVVLQIRARSGHALPIDPLANLLTTNPPGRQQQVVADVYQQLIDLVEVVGNLRLQAVTVALPGLTGQARPYMAISFRGQFDQKAVADALRARFHTYFVGGVPMYEGNYATYFLPSSGTFVAVMGPHVPLMYIVGAMAGGHNTLSDSPVMSAALKQADMTQPVWGVAKITPPYRKLAPMLEPFDTLTLGSRDDGQRLHLTLAAAGRDLNDVATSVNGFNTFLKTVQGQGAPPIFLPLAKAADSIHCQSDGLSVSVTADMPSSLLDAMLGAVQPGADGGAPTISPAAGQH
jgi:hypothetical protein